MPERDKRNKEDDDIELSDATEKRIDQLPEHAQHIFKKAYASALKEYEDPKKRREVQRRMWKRGLKSSLGCCEEGLQEKGR